jgi:hypothetical protein
MKIAGQNIGEYFKSRGITILIDHTTNCGSLAAWARHPDTGLLDLGLLNEKFQIRGWLVRLQRIAVVKHARFARQNAEFSAARLEREKQEAEMHTVPKPLPSMRRVRRVAAPISQ